MPILECEVLYDFFEIDSKEGDMNRSWHFTQEVFFLGVVFLDFFFEEEDVLGVLLIFLVSLLDNFFGLHLKDIDKMVELLQILC